MNFSVPSFSFGAKLDSIFGDINIAYERIEARLKADQFKQRVMACFRAWEDAAIYPTEFLIKLQNVFLGLFIVDKDVKEPSVPVRSLTECQFP